MTGYIATGTNGGTHVWVGCTKPSYDNSRKATGELLHILRFTPDEARYVIEQLQLEIQRVEQEQSDG